MKNDDLNGKASRRAFWDEFFYIFQIAFWLFVIVGCLIAVFGG